MFLPGFPSDGAVGRRKAASSQAPQAPERRPPSPPGSPPASAPCPAPQEPSPETPLTQDISPAVAAALLQLISQQEAEPRAQGEEPQHGGNEDAAEAAGALESSDQQGAAGAGPPSWTQPSDSPKTQPQNDPKPAHGTVAQFPRDQDFRFSHGAPSEPGALGYTSTETWGQGAENPQGNSQTQTQTQGQGANRAKGPPY